jgi:DNA-directed RNA polymerase subunit F
MSGPEVLEKNPMNLTQVREELARIRKRDGDLDIRGQKTEEYTQGFSSLLKKEAEELFQKLEKLNVPRLKEAHIHKLIDLLPATVPELKVVMQGYSITITAENMKKICETIESFKKKK